MLTAPKPHMSSAALGILDGLGPGSRWSVRFEIGGVAVQMARVADPSRRGAFARDLITWSAGTASGDCLSVVEAMQAVTIRALVEAGVPALELTPFEAPRLDACADSVTAASVYRDILLRRTGRRWSVTRKGDIVTISSMPRDRVRGKMRFGDAALLAVIGGRVEPINPATGIRVVCSSQGAAMAKTFAGCAPDGRISAAQ